MKKLLFFVLLILSVNLQAKRWAIVHTHKYPELQDGFGAQIGEIIKDCGDSVIIKIKENFYEIEKIYIVEYEKLEEFFLPSDTFPMQD